MKLYINYAKYGHFAELLQTASRVFLEVFVILSAKEERFEINMRTNKKFLIITIY